MRFKLIAILGAFAMGTAASAQVLNERIPGKDVLSGDATAQLEDIGRRAAAEGLVLQVNAPDLWEAEILTPVRRGAGDRRLEIKFVNTLKDTVVIRGVEPGENEDPLETLKRITNNAKARSIEGGEQDQAQTQAAPAPSASSQPQQPSSAAPEIERPDMDVPEVKVERPRAQLPRSDAHESSRRAREGGSASARAASPAPSNGADSATPEMPPRSNGSRAAAEAEAVRFARLYNNGRDIRRSLSAGELEPGDLVFTGDHHNVVVRRGISTDTFWLEGPVPEDRLAHRERNRYRVIEPRPAASARAAENSSLPGTADERERFERLYNNGRDIDDTIVVGELQEGDEIYTGDSVTVVLRRSRVSIDAYWLQGSLDTQRPGIEHEQQNKYIVVKEVE